MKKIRERFNEYTDELINKVQWPKMSELQNSTITVLTASGIVAVIIALVDFLLSNASRFLYQIFQ